MSDNFSYWWRQETPGIVFVFFLLLYVDDDLLDDVCLAYDLLDDLLESELESAPLVLSFSPPYGPCTPQLGQARWCEQLAECNLAFW
jgi:hypothetical protein